ncbi:hypothetical protein [Stenomitos frigidus]|uniref:VOC domain-containing protein n=1 Tax=Stenomitos frigidus ULC18 TaxID=2107698 RepID=A0A2T1E154_9CYAN|nr:hypothetical protein [Stenomitos frigidus]PSB26486.1 hypothetical protein C7B82_19630 [Stenomitos frigidus ULC18]
MFHHISVAVKDPQHVATVLAEILCGRAVPFPPNPGSYMALAGDEFGTLIEFYPIGSELIPDSYQGQAGFQINQNRARYTFVHAALSVPASLEEIERIGDREGWRVFLANRDGLFDVIEFWVENWLMLELLTPIMTPKYLQALNPETLPALIDQFTLVESRR